MLLSPAEAFALAELGNTSLAALGALTHRLQRLQNPKWPLGSPKKGSCQLSLDKFFDQSIPSMRKVDNGKNEKIMSFTVTTNVVTSRPTGTPTARANSFKTFL